MTQQIICAGAVEFSPGRCLDGSPCTYVRLRLLVDNERLWLEDAESDAANCLAANDIIVYGSKKIGNTTIARINVRATALADFEEWNVANSTNGELRLRTFLNVLGVGDKSMFGTDDYWNKVEVEGRPLSYWYTKLVEITV